MFRYLSRIVIRRATRAPRPTKLVAIVVPLSARPALLPEEEVSLRHLRRFLGRYDIFLLAPPSSPLRIPGLRRMDFPAKFFGSAAAHNHLTYAPEFYRAFGEYRHVFFYHLDSLVFSDQLEQWCAAGVDYIGPPWIRCADTPWITRPRVGNGGFTLLNVASALAVLRAMYLRDPFAYWLHRFTRNGPRVEPVLNLLRRLQRRFPRSRVISRPLEEWEQMRHPSPHNRNNDVFWSDKAAYYHPAFRVASLEQGLRFAFEACPRACFELNGGVMPFGCHAWARYDRAFWEPFLLDGKGAAPAGSAAGRAAGSR